MVDLVPSCFRPSEPGPTSTTSMYETRLGTAALTWTGGAAGLAVVADLSELVGLDLDQFRIRPKRRGSKRFRRGGHVVELAWDLTRAEFNGGPEPAGGFSVSAAVDGEILLVAGDIYEGRPIAPAIISRRDRVVEKGGKRSISYETTARFGGKEREISIDLERQEEGEVMLGLGVNGRRVLEVTRLRWKFRGTERVEGEEGDQIQVSWDLHDWLFRAKGDGGSDSGHAMFVIRFEVERGEGYCGKGGGGGGQFGEDDGDWSDSSSDGGSSSESSTLTSSSVGGAGVAAWASPEEAWLRSAEGFSLMVSVCKK